MKTYQSIILLFIAYIAYSCDDSTFNKPYGDNDGTAPGKVELLSYEAIPGGAVLKYRNPSDEDLLYVKVKYTLDTGTEQEQRASAYANTITIQGFGNVSEKTIEISAVDRMENEGEVNEYSIIPGEPAFQTAFETMSAFETFGGVGITMQNEFEDNLMVDVITTDSVGEWYIAHTEYTSRKDISFSVRGFDSIPRTFGISVRDPFENVTEVAYAEVTPWYEMELDKGKFAEIILDNDTPVNAWGFSMSRIWNGTTAYGANNMLHSSESNPWPHFFTFDLGVTAQLSRYKYWQRLQDDYLYQHGNLQFWELYGRADTPSQDGSWDGWELIMSCESIKPSGLPAGEYNNEDKEYAAAGEEFEFDLETPPVRYIRWKAVSTFTGAEFIHFQQVSFYGIVTEE